MEKLLTAKEVADFLNCHPQSIYRNTELPRIILPGVGIRFKESDIENYIARKTIKIVSILDPQTTCEPFRFTNLEDFDKIYLKGDGGSMNKKKTRWNYGFGSVYIRKTRQGKERWYVDYQANGKRTREVVKNAQIRAEAVLYLKERVSEAFNHVHKPSTHKPITFEELGEVYLQNYAKPNKRSWKADMYRIEANLKPFFGDMQLKDITPLLIEKYRAERLETGVSKSTVNREITIMKRMFNLAIDWDFAVVNPVLKIKLFSEKDKQKERILTEDEEIRLLAASPDYLKPIIVTALNTGMRRGEILNLKWKKVDLKKQQIRVEQTKSGKIRTIPINDVLLQELWKVRRLGICSDYVFPNPRTEKPYVDVKKSFKEACSQARIEDLRFHDLRHTFATRLIESGADIITVRDLLGHFSIRVTQRYTHSNQIQKKEAVQKLARKVLQKPENQEGLAHICHKDSEQKINMPVKSSVSIN